MIDIFAIVLIGRTLIIKLDVSNKSRGLSKFNYQCRKMGDDI